MHPEAPVGAPAHQTGALLLGLRCRFLHSQEFLILDEPGFILLRVEADNGITGRIRASLEEAIRPIFSQITAQSWSPQADAKNRILDARRRAGILDGIPGEGWMIKGKNPNGWWIPAPEDLDKQVTAFSTFMSKVLGKFTKAYLKEIPYRVEDRWLMSVFVHLILDSVSTNQTEENEI